MLKKETLSRYLKRINILSKYRRIRVLVKHARNQGMLDGMAIAEKDFEIREQKLKKLCEDDLADERKRCVDKIDYNDEQNRKHIKRITEDYEEQINKLKSDFLVKEQELKTANKNEIEDYDKNYKEKCDRNDELRRDAVKQYNTAKDKAIKSENYWREQITKVNEFISAAVGVMRTIGDRYKFLQGSLSKVQVGQDMMDELNKAYQSLVKDANKDSPPLLGDEKFTNKK